MKLYYIWDAYCGWTYGFAYPFTEFMKEHPELETEIISGGLFWGENKKKIMDFKEAQSINKKIEEYYGMAFGKDYNELFSSGNMIMDSLGPARVFSILRKHVSPERHVELTLDIQKIFFDEGKDLSCAASYDSIIGDYMLDNGVMDELKKALEEEEEAHQDFIKAHKLGIQSYPTLILEKDGNWYQLNRNVRSKEDLERNFSKLYQSGGVNQGVKF